MQGYDFEPDDNSPYVRLKAKGDRVKIRLASVPIHYGKEYKAPGESEPKARDRFAWLVIDKSNSKDVRVKGFEAGVLVYKAIKELALSEDWGDPTTYDLTITRTEEQGNYYTVTPSPNKSPLTEAEKKMVKDSGLDLVTLFKVDEKEMEHTKTFGNGSEPEEEEEPKKVDLPQREKTPTEEINLDDIPFG